MTRGEVKALLRTLLATDIDDPAYGDTAGSGLSPTLDPIVQQAVDSLIEDIYAEVPGYAPKVAVLAASAPTARTYPFVSQTPPITDFSHWIKVRWDSEDGTSLDEVSREELTTAGFACFAIMGADELAVLETSWVSEAGHPIWIEYGFRPADLVDDTSAIPLIPKKYHDVVALEGLFAFDLGGESVCPPNLLRRWQNRRAQLMARVSRRGTMPKRTKLDPRVVQSYL